VRGGSIKSLNGLERRVTEYRLLFHKEAGERPIEFPRIHGSDHLAEFLTDKLEQASATVNRLLDELESGHGATVCIRNLAFDVAELNAKERILSRNFWQSAKSLVLIP
jgi:hypothetical protein